MEKLCAVERGDGLRDGVWHGPVFHPVALDVVDNALFFRLIGMGCLGEQVYGLSRAELMGFIQVGRSLHDHELFDALIADLCGQGFSCAHGTIQRQSHRPSLPASLAEAGEKIRAALAAKPFDPPSRKELIPDGAAQKALRFLNETGEVIVINEEVLLSAEAFEQMKSLLAQALRERGPSTVSELRQALGTTRRVLVPLLERCDRDGLTSRQGDRRTLRSR